MILHNLKTSWRWSMKYKLQTGVSVLSLAVGMVCFSLSALWLRYEKCYDTQWKDAEKIHMVAAVFPKTSADSTYGKPVEFTSYRTGERLAEFPEVKAVTRHRASTSSGMEALGGKAAEGPLTSLAIDSTYLDFFGIKVVEGNPHFVLHEGEVALTEGLARKLFPLDAGALGRKVRKDDGEEAVVAAIVQDAPKPTSIPYDYMEPFPPLDDMDKRHMLVCHTFFKAEDAAMDRLNRRLENDTVVEQHTCYYEKDVLIHQPVTVYSIEHYKTIPLTRLRQELPLQKVNVSLRYLHLFLLMGVIAVACALYGYLATLMAGMRIRRRGIVLRHVHGARMTSIMGTFATELAIIIGLSLITGTVAFMYLLPRFRSTCLIDRSDGYYFLWFLAFSSAIAVVSMFIVGVAIALSLRRSLRDGMEKRAIPAVSRSSAGQRMNLTLQLMVSLCAAYCSIVMTRQINYMFYSPEMGIAKHGIGIINAMREGSQALEEELRAIPEIEEIHYGYEYPIPDGFQMRNFTWRHGGRGGDISMRGCCISADYASTIGLSLVKGEMLQDGEDDKLLITETAARLMGDGDPIGAKIYAWAEWRDKTVKGVVKDIYYESPTAAPEALCFDLMEKGAEADRVCHYVFRYREGTDWNALCDKINTAVSHHTDKTLITEKAEDIYDQCISSERTMCSLLTIMAGVCIFITVFSLLGMVSLSCRRRRKEIAIRKVHGAKRLQIVRLFLRSYIHALLVGSAVSLPVGYWLMHQWLMDYHKQASIPWWLYPAIVVTMGLVMFLTVFHQIYKASRENPADVLKSE